jgi:hypothetical protein
MEIVQDQDDRRLRRRERRGEPDEELVVHGVHARGRPGNVRHRDARPRKALMTWLHSTRGLLSNSSRVTQATRDEDWFRAAHEAMASVLPVPGGPISAVSGPCTPSAMSWSSRGRGTAQSGAAGIVILDLRIDTSESAAARAPFR